MTLKLLVCPKISSKCWQQVVSLESFYFLFIIEFLYIILLINFKNKTFAKIILFIHHMSLSTVKFLPRNFRKSSNFALYFLSFAFCMVYYKSWRLICTFFSKIFTLKSIPWGPINEGNSPCHWNWLDNFFHYLILYDYVRIINFKVEFRS